VNPLATYSFLPWLRGGIANTIKAADEDSEVKSARVSTRVELKLTGDPSAGGQQLTEPVKQDIALYGPGDVVGIDARAVVRTEPHNWITNFEANHMAAVDFYEEDLPWRYTPAAPDGAQLRPWITLAVLEEGEFRDGTDPSGRPLPYITIPDPKLLPPAADLWAWAHVHFNQPLAGAPGEIISPDMQAVLPRVQAILAQSPDAAYARLLSPRRLEDETAYHAFVIPSFESGRLAGIGLSPDGAKFATASAWAPYTDRPQGSEYPYYYRWSFQTGSHGDFEYLVELLKPQVVDSRVGSRDIDVRAPGYGLSGIDEGLGGVLKLGGALRVPEESLKPAEKAERKKFEAWDENYPRPFQKSLAAFVNLPDDYIVRGQEVAHQNPDLGEIPEEDDPDPLITAPIYGRWHALARRLMKERNGAAVADDRNWLHRLNLDPRFRVAAGSGGEVVAANDEQYMNYAWQQIGDVLDANAQIRRLHLATDVSARWFDEDLKQMAEARPERAFALTAPVHRRIRTGAVTLEHRRRTSLVPPVLTSTAMRRVVRPGGRLMRSLPFDAAVTPDNLLERVDAGEVSAAPPKTAPPGAPTVDDVAGAAGVAGLPPWLRVLARLFPWLAWLLIALAFVLLALAVLLLPSGIGWAVGLAVFVVLMTLAWLLLRRRALAQAIEEANQKPAAVGKLPHNPGFELTDPGSGHSTPTGKTDSATAERLKKAIEDSFAVIEASAEAGRRPEPATLPVPEMTEEAVAGVDPTVTIPERGMEKIKLPDWVEAERLDDYGEVRAYPKIDLPMYEPLKTLSTELFLPNLNLIPPNSITLVETNQEFIESYMVGLNHEFGRELLWREFPTDQRGSCFRQFWDVRSVIGPEGMSKSDLREKLYDIPKLNKWTRASELGKHNQRQAEGAQKAQTVLVVRGELLKKYPTAVIYAHRATWELEADGETPDLTKPRRLVTLEPGEETEPPKTKMQVPLFEAKVDPDIYFFGFDLSTKEARGESGVPPEVDPGWFFVIKERPGDPRFGLDLSSDGQAEVVDELTWDGAQLAGGPGKSFLDAASFAPVALKTPPNEAEGKKAQHEDDAKAVTATASSARWAYLLFRAPVMVAIHAIEMLEEDS
jgi:hypothetical protein